MAKEKENSSLTPAQNMNLAVSSVLGSTALEGFEKAYKVAEATQQLKDLLTPEYMKPIMALQGSRLGFKTDRDANGGYPIEVVKSCLIEAVLMGVQPHGNQFNIIAGNCYLTKEGFGYLLSNYEGLSFRIVPQLPRIKEGSGAVMMNISWTINGIQQKEVMDIPVKVNNHMGTDAVIGKATRKARAWLYNTITGSEIADGDVDAESRVVATRMTTGSGEVIETITEEDLQLLLDMKREVLTAEEITNAERILNNKEVNSYSKLLKLLQSK